MSIKQASQLMNTKLSDIALVPNGNIYPLIADADVDYPFIVYSLSEEAEASKRSLEVFDVEVAFYGLDYNDLADKYDALKALFDSDNDLIFRSGSLSVNIEKPEEFIFILTYQLTI